MCVVVAMNLLNILSEYGLVSCDCILYYYMCRCELVCEVVNYYYGFTITRVIIICLLFLCTHVGFVGLLGIVRVGCFRFDFP